MNGTNMASNSNFMGAIKTIDLKLEKLSMAEEAYAAGMAFVIKEMAYVLFHNKYIDLNDTTPEESKADKEANDAMDQLRDILNQEQYKLVLKIEDKLTYSQHLAEERSFIQGFFEGYKYVKELS